MVAQTKTLSTESPRSASKARWSGLYKLGGISALVMVAYSLATMIIVFTIGAMPETALEGFNMLQNDRLVGLLRFDILATLSMPFYYPLFLVLYHALKKTDEATALLATLFVFAGLTLFLSTPSVFSWLTLSDKYAAAATDAQRTQFLAAGETLLASNMWNSSAAVVGGLLLQTGAVLIAVLMLSSSIFGKWTGWLGIIMFGLDLAHIPVVFFLPELGNALVPIAGTIYIVWFPLVAWQLFKAAKSVSQT